MGSRPHRGHVAIGHFYDTFIGPRAITHHPDVDLVVGTTVVRDLELEIQMASALTMRVPTFIRYDLKTENDELRSRRAVGVLGAARDDRAVRARRARPPCPPESRSAERMFANQGLSGSLGFLSGFQGVGTGGKGLFARFLDEACGGDEIGVRRLAADIPITLGDTEPLTTSDLVKHLSGGTWDKLDPLGACRGGPRRPRRPPQRAHRRPRRRPGGHIPDSAVRRIPSDSATSATCRDRAADMRT